MVHETLHAVPVPDVLRMRVVPGLAHQQDRKAEIHDHVVQKRLVMPLDQPERPAELLDQPAGAVEHRGVRRARQHQDSGVEIGGANMPCAQAMIVERPFDLLLVADVLDDGDSVWIVRGGAQMRRRAKVERRRCVAPDYGIAAVNVECPVRRAKVEYRQLEKRRRERLARARVVQLHVVRLPARGGGLETAPGVRAEHFADVDRDDRALLHPHSTFSYARASRSRNFSGLKRAARSSPASFNRRRNPSSFSSPRIFSTISSTDCGFT